MTTIELVKQEDQAIAPRGLLLALGYKTRLTALVLAIFSVVTGVIFHHALGDQNQMIHFLKNLALTGGLLQVVAFGAGAFSLDTRTPKLIQRPALFTGSSGQRSGAHA